MLKEERLQRIVKMLEQSDMIKVADIMKELQVADMTVRRDLQALEEAGLLVRLHGGATKAGYKERSNTEKQSLNQKEKRRLRNKQLHSFMTMTQSFSGLVQQMNRCMDIFRLGT